MIDKIRFSKKNLSDSEIANLVQKNHLETHTLNGLKHWNNDTTKNFTGGLSIRIDKNKALKIEGSLHKYSTYLTLKKLDNFDSFTMVQAKQTYLKMIENIGFEPKNASVSLYEIGLNINTDVEPKEFLKKIYSIGDLNNEKIFYIDPKFKKESQKTTETHRDYRAYFKTYDKIHEMQDNKKEVPNLKIIRIETVHKRVEKTLLEDFFKVENLQSLQNSFFNKWDKLNFEIELTAPKGTNQNRFFYAHRIFKFGKENFLNEINLQYRNGTLSIKMYYTQKRFIENWENEKLNFTPVKSTIYKKWENIYSAEKQRYNKINTL